MERKVFIEKYTEIVRLAIKFADIARIKGIIWMESELQNIDTDDDRDIFRYGITQVIDGDEPEYIDKILTNIINQEVDNDVRLLKTIQKEAVMSIQQGLNPRIMIAILNSYTNISLAENKEIISCQT